MKVNRAARIFSYEKEDFNDPLSVKRDETGMLFESINTYLTKYQISRRGFCQPRIFLFIY